MICKFLNWWAEEEWETNETKQTAKYGNKRFLFRFRVSEYETTKKIYNKTMQKLGYLWLKQWSTNEIINSQELTHLWNEKQNEKFERFEWQLPSVLNLKNWS